MIEIDISKCPKDPSVKIYYPDGSLLTETDNVIMFNYIRSEIAKNKWEGFTMQTEDGKSYNIGSNGFIKCNKGEEDPYVFKAMTDVTSKLLRYGRR